MSATALKSAVAVALATFAVSARAGRHELRGAAATVLDHLAGNAAADAAQA